MMIQWLSLWWTGVWQLLTDSAFWLLAGFGVAGFVYVLLPIEKLTKHLGGSNFSSVVKAAAIGVPLPLCSCSVIPVASSLRKNGAGKGAFLSFLISTPETGADSIAISYALLGPVLAVARPLAAAVTALIAGVLINSRSDAEVPPAGDTESDANSSEDASCCSGDSCHAATPPAEDGRPRWLAAVHYGFVEMIADLAPWLVAGFALAGLASALMPAGFLERHVGAGPLALLLMLLVGLPLYVCATSSTPIAAALIAKGLSPGAALVFLLAGPATNVATMMIVLKHAGRWGVGIYLGAISVVAVGTGWLIDSFGLAALGGGSHHAGGTDLAVGPVDATAAIVMLLLIANGLRLRLWKTTSHGDHAGHDASA